MSWKVGGLTNARNTYTFLLWSRFRRCKVWNLFRPLIHILPPSLLSIRRVMSNATCPPLRQMIPRQRRILSPTRLSRAVVDDMQRRINRNAPFIDSQATLSCSAQTHKRTQIQQTLFFPSISLSLYPLPRRSLFSLQTEMGKEKFSERRRRAMTSREQTYTRARAISNWEAKETWGYLLLFLLPPILLQYILFLIPVLLFHTTYVYIWQRRLAFMCQREIPTSNLNMAIQ